MTFELDRAPGESWRDFVGGICGSFGIALMHVHHISAMPRGIARSAGRRSPCRTATRCTISMSRARPSRFTAPTACTAARRSTRPSARAASPPSRPSPTSTSTQWRARHHALAARRGVSHRAVAMDGRYAAALLSRLPGDGDPARLARGPAGSDRPACARPSCCPPTTFRPWPCWAPSVRTRARAGSSGWRELARARGAARALRADRHHGCPAWSLAVRRRGADRARPLRDRRPARLCSRTIASRLVLYPSAGPETFSYTLTEAWACGRPVLVPPIGAWPSACATAAPAGS